jgi:hypothetical protein
VAHPDALELGTEKTDNVCDNDVHRSPFCQPTSLHVPTFVQNTILLQVQRNQDFVWRILPAAAD